jgi:small subunit ribosomal protein S18
MQIPASATTARFFSKDEEKSSSKAGHDDDPFGINFEDGTDHGKLGPSMPPRYKRDTMTGKFTGERETELTEQERQLLKMDTLQEQEYILEKLMKGWDISDDEEGSVKLSQLAQRVREDNTGLNVLGRSVESQSVKGKLEDGDDAYVDPSGFSKPLSPAEFKVFQKYMSNDHKVDIDEDDIAVENTDDSSTLKGYADDEYLNAKWMSSSAVRFMDDTKDDDPFSDLLPSDLTPTRLVNRRKAKKIPRHLLHHNNLALLRRYITPTGQIMNRVQSRLGAKDQRRIAKLIKRARAMGLLPMAGQFAIESHGNIHEQDLQEDKEWEKELIARGLTINSNQSTKKN